MGMGNFTMVSCGVVTLFQIEEGSTLYYIDLFLVIFNSVTSLSSLLLNIVWIRLLLQTQRTLSSSTVLLITLASVDIVICTVVQPLFIVTQISQILPHFNSSCIVRHLYSFSGYASSGFLLILLTIMASDRVAAVLLVGKYREIVTRKRYITLLTITFVYVVLVSGVYSGSLISKALFLTYLGISITVCLIIITICYCYLAYFLLSKRNRIRSGSGHSLHDFRVTVTKVKSKAETLATRRRMVTIFILVGVALACYFPQGVLLMIRPHIADKSSLVLAIDSTTDTLAFLMGTVNPLCYLFRRRKRLREPVLSYRSS